MEGGEQYNRASGYTGRVLRLTVLQLVLLNTAVGTAIIAVGAAVGTAGHSTGVLPDTVRMFRIQHGFAGQQY